ncbi:MAG: hypothetical protein IAB19_06720 [Proteobacteria bacterium]|uniref:Uncharacterized protein n=1 Tax=Candidatus Avisuccinivibrio stercorigallinarum TaxID=2840704 RepID=A0A9D9DBH1_9GAMM|nr:hypothetical protein [Candidatus Avisuccinivibrio stercorigallinarum]
MLRKFHPLYNEDGSLSKFRTACLIIIALCMIGYALLSAQRSQVSAEGSTPAPSAQVNPDGSETLSAAGLQQAPGGIKSMFSDESDQKQQQLLQHRSAALTEMEDGAQFLSSCGNINAGFEGCRFEFSDKVLKFYDATVEAADDGFSIVLKAKGDQLEDLCVEYGINSQGTVYAYDKQGHEQQACLPESLKVQKFSAVHRLTDDILPNAAPSGAQPVITSITSTGANAKVNTEDEPRVKQI